MAHPGGRPTVYSDEMVAKAEEYLLLCQDSYKLQIKTQTTNETENGSFYNTVKENKLKAKIPTVDGLAKYINVNRSTIYEWIKLEKAKEFSNVYNEIMEEQADRLINMSITGEYNSVIASLMLSKHGYIRKEEIEETKKINLDSKDIDSKSLEDIQDYINNKLN